MNADAYGDALDGALREIDRLSRLNDRLYSALHNMVEDGDATDRAQAVAVIEEVMATNHRPVAQPANTDSVSGSPGSESTRPDQPKLPESGGIAGSSIGMGAEGEQ